MVALQTVLQSNVNIAWLPSGIVALFVGATSGIGQSTLQHSAEHATAPHIYSVACPQTIDKIVATITQKETKLDILVWSAGGMAFEGCKDTREGLEPSMSTRCYSPLCAMQQLLPLLNAAPSPRVISVLAGGHEAQMNEADLDLRQLRLARSNPGLSVVHWYPGAVATPGLAKWDKYGLTPPNQRSQDEAGARGVFLATSDRYAVQSGLVLVPGGPGGVNKSGRGIFLVDADGESIDNEGVLVGFRERGVDEVVWSHTEKVWAECAARAGSPKDEL
ncbi:hypothetical protein B0H14DRAFT_3114086 [Mycena olivaceomarginata]|nr:hypothetical protein B0H14DRAFT_3114086 [Mycena olivaceomarginata]